MAIKVLVVDDSSFFRRRVSVSFMSIVKILFFALQPTAWNTSNTLEGNRFKKYMDDVFTAGMGGALCAFDGRSAEEPKNLDLSRQLLLLQWLRLRLTS